MSNSVLAGKAEVELSPGLRRPRRNLSRQEVLVGFLLIAGAIAMYLHKRHDVVIRYAGAEVRIGRFKSPQQAQALAEAIASRLPQARAGVG